MATTTTKNKKPSKATKPTMAGMPATRADNVLQALAPKWPALTHAERALFASRYSDAKCEAMGAGTKSEGVLSDALGWAPTIDRALTAYPVELRRYGGARFSWFLGCIDGLAAERAAQQSKGGAAAAMKVLSEKAQKAALAARTELVDSLEELVEGDEKEEAALSAALGSTDRADRIVASLGTLGGYARQWLSRKDERSKSLVKWAGLTLAEVETAENAATALAQAAAGKTLEGAVVARDSPQVNRVEGRVLLEMRAAMRVFNKANARNKHVPRLVPGDASRNALASRAAKTAKGDAPKAANPATPTDT